MDIRNFFAAKKPKSGAKTSSSTSASSGAKSKPKQKSSSSNSKSGNLGKRQNNDEEDRKRPGLARKTSITDRKKFGTSGKRRSTSSTSNDRVEVSASDFFAEAAAAPPPKKQQKPSPPKKSTILIEDTSDEGGTPTSSPTTRKTKPTTSVSRTASGTKPSSQNPAVVTIDSKRPSKKRVRPIMDDSEDGDEDFLPHVATGKPPPKKQASPPSKAVAPPRKRTPPKKSTNSKSDPPIQPSLEADSFDVDGAVPQCLEGMTFCFSGELEGLGRNESQEMVKILGGRATGSVSGKTTYLVLGEMLEDGRPYTEGKKYKAAVERGTIQVLGVTKFYGLLKMYNERAKAKQVDTPRAVDSQPPASRTRSMPNSISTARTVSNASTATASSTSSKPPPVNPYTKKPVNPYAKSRTGVSNPYASSKSGASNPHTTGRGHSAASPVAKAIDPLALWADAHAPTSTKEILGNQSFVKQLTEWLRRWETTFNNPKAHGKVFTNAHGPRKAALLSGPPGIGKTTTATLVAKEAGRDILELNASDSRGKKALTQNLGDVTGSHVLDFGTDGGKKKKGPPRLRCIIMDEVDGMGAGDRSGMSELISMIKKSMVPIICICNDRQSQKIKSLAPYCVDLRFKRPNKSVIARRAIRIGELHGLRVEQNAAEAIAESCGNDIRQVVNSLQMWASKGDRSSSLTYKELKEREKSMNKDEMLRVNMFDACRLIVQGPRDSADADPKAARESFFKRNDAYFVDYSLMGLLVHQNYPKVLQSGYSAAKRSGSADEVNEFLERMSLATDAMSDFALTEQAIRSGDQNWGLLPTCAALAVKTGYHAGGENGGIATGNTEFAAWLGKNSSRGKKVRLLKELGHHMNYKVSGGTTELRLAYLPLLRQHFRTYMTDPDATSRMEEMIGVMDEYGLDRDDVFENMDEFKMDPKAEALNGILDSKQKAAFTRLYNSRAHKSQALVAEQGAGKVSKKRKSTGSAAPKELGAIDEDGGGSDDDEEEEEELTEEKLRAMFKGKGRKRSLGKKKPGKSGTTTKKRKTSAKKK